MSNPLSLDDQIREAIAAAPAEGRSLHVAYVDADGYSHVSPRSSVVVLGDQTLGLWARKPHEGLAASIAERPKVTLLYVDFAVRGVMYTFYGVASVTTDAALDERIWTEMPEVERTLDPDRKGAAVVVDLERIVGLGRQPDRNFTLQR